MFSGGIFLNESDKRLARLRQFSFLAQPGCCLKFGQADVRRRWRSNFAALLFLNGNFFLEKGVVPKPAGAAENDQRKQHYEKPFHGCEAAKALWFAGGAPRRLQGRAQQLCIALAGQRFIPGIENQPRTPSRSIGHKLRSSRAGLLSGEKPVPEPSDGRLFPVAPGKVTILAVKLLGNDLESTEHGDQRRRHEFSSHLRIFDVG